MDYIIAKSIASSAYESGGLFHYIKFKIEMKKQKHQIKRDEQYSRVKSEVERYRCETYDDEIAARHILSTAADGARLFPK